MILPYFHELSLASCLALYLLTALLPHDLPVVPLVSLLSSYPPALIETVIYALYPTGYHDSDILSLARQPELLDPAL